MLNCYTLFTFFTYSSGNVPDYLGANLYIYRSLHYPSPVDAAGKSYTSASPRSTVYIKY